MAINQAYGSGGGTLLTNVSGWYLKNNTKTDNAGNTNIVRDEEGYYDPNSAKMTGARMDITEVWEAAGDSTSLPGNLKVGKVDADTNIDSISLNCTNSGRPTLTIVGHVHQAKASNAPGHLDGSYACSFQFPSGAYGAVNPFGSAVSDVDDAEVTSSTQTYAMNHQDENASNGELLAGISRGVTMTGHMECTTANNVTSGVKSGGLIVNSSSKPLTNEGLQKLTVDGVKYINEKGGGSST